MADNDRNPITTTNEQHERDLNRHRGEEQRTARAEIVARLADAGVEVRDDESLEAVVRKLDEVEARERAIQERGGDLMIEEKPRLAD